MIAATRNVGSEDIMAEAKPTVYIHSLHQVLIFRILVCLPVLLHEEYQFSLIKAVISEEVVATLDDVRSYFYHFQLVLLAFVLGWSVLLGTFSDE